MASELCPRCSGRMGDDYGDRACIVCGYREYPDIERSRADAQLLERRDAVGRRYRGGRHG